jgi:hypothetical protein
MKKTSQSLHKCSASQLITINKDETCTQTFLPRAMAKPPTTKLNADTGATEHFLAASDAATLTDLRPAGQNSVVVHLPDGTTAESSHIGELPFPQLPPAARNAHVLQTFTGSLLSVGQICDSDHTIAATFDWQGVHIHRGDETLLRGRRDQDSKVYEISTSQPPAHSASPVIRHQSHADMVRYYYAALGSPVWSTFIAALTSGILKLPGLTADIARKNPHNSIPSALGHLSRTRKNLRSTKPPLKTPEPPSPTDTEPSEPDDVDMTMVRTDDTFVDGTGPFPVQSRRGIKYVLVSTRLGYIHLTPLPTRTAASQTKAHAEALQFWTAHGMRPKRARFDNETSAELEGFYAAAGIPIQFFPAGNHRSNAAERAVRSVKEHFTAMLATTDPEFPLLDWDLLLPQAEITVNLLRPATVDPTVSAWDHMRGAYDFNAYPFGPPGCKVVVYESAATRGSWAAHGAVGFYTGPALGHYRGFRVWVPQTNRERVSDTIAWFPRDVVMPGSSPLEHVTAATTDLERAILVLAQAPGNQHLQLPLGILGPQLAANLGALRDLYQTAAPLPPGAGPAVPVPYMVGPDPAAPTQSPAPCTYQPRDQAPTAEGPASPMHAYAPSPQQQRVGDTQQRERVGESPQRPRV